MTNPNWPTGNRTKPYTEAGIKRLKCVRCGQRAYSTWQACADGGFHRPLCLDCDIALNRMVLIWMAHPWATQLAAEYEQQARGAT
jgi:hypothetical protein